MPERLSPESKVSYVNRPIFFLTLLLLSNACLSEDQKVFNQIQERHKRMHEQVSPAVVAVEYRGGKSSLTFYGTGVVVSPEGLVLTSSTVVPAGTRTVQIYFPDGKVVDARVLERDENTESCVMQVVQAPGDTRKLAYLELSDSSKAEVGQLAYTAGNPFHTISRDGQVAWSVGTISGLYKINSADEQSKYRGPILETDAAVNPGSDGGPLIDGEGRLLGILSLCFCESRWLGTAVPVHLIKRALAPLSSLPLADPRTTSRLSANCSSDIGAGGAGAACAVPDALRAACRPAATAMVKLLVKRSESARDPSSKPSLVRRLRQRPDAPSSGVIFDSEGYILTSAFNVEGEVLSIDAQLADGTTLPATLLARHLGFDIAVLKIEPPRGRILPAMPLNAEPALCIGRYVTVLGSSEDSPSVTQTMGIVSAIGRLDGCAVQTDALINYGNSGGAVVDLRGRLVGIAAHVRTNTDWSHNSGVGFFTQSDKIIACMADLKAGRDIKAPVRPFLGVSPVDNATDIRGVKLEEVLTGSAASDARLVPGDVIIAVDGMDTHSWPALVRVLKAHKPGDTIEITYQRGTVTARTSTVLKTRKEAR